jgi:hypothetical protein
VNTRAVIGVLIASCVSIAARQASSQQLPRTEVVVLVDLSDRIDQHLHPGQAARDTAILHIVADEFANVVKRHRFLFSRDRLRVIFVGGENSPVEPRVDVTQMNDDHRVVVRELARELAKFRNDASAPFFIQRKKYLGADLWSWFRFNGAKQLLSEEPGRKTQRRVIILTDGYLQFSPKIHRDAGTAMRMDALRNHVDWQQTYAQYKLKSPGVRLPNTKVLLLEVAPIHPETNTAEQEILEKYWGDWFATMGAPSTLLTTDEALPSVRDAVRLLLADR